MLLRGPPAAQSRSSTRTAWERCQLPLALTVIGTTSVEGNLAVGAGATFNASGAVSVGGSLAVSGGTLAMSAAATSTVSASVTNSGTIDVQAGALDLTGAVTNTGT